MRHDFLRLRPRLRATFYVVSAVLFGSGAGWWIAHAWLGETIAPDSPIEQISRSLLNVHGAAAMLTLLVLGVLYPLHILRGWRAHRNRRWGGALVLVCVVLIATGYLLYYSGNEALREFASSTHVWLGLGSPAILLVHIWRGRATRSK